LNAHKPLSLLTFAICGFATWVTLRQIFEPAILRAKRRGENIFSAFAADFSNNNRRVGGYVVHLAVIMVAVAVTASSSYRVSAEATLQPGQTIRLQDYELTFLRREETPHPHRHEVAAVMSISKNSKVLGEARPRLNFYERQREPVGTPHVRSFANEDLYMSLMAFNRDAGHVSVKAYAIPLVPWLW